MSTNQFADPYRPSQNPTGDTPQFPPGHKPAVWTWYVIYCVCMALIYLLCLIAGIGMIVASQVGDMTEEGAIVFIIQGIVFSGLGLVFLVFFAAAPFLPKTKFAWIYGFVTIGLGFTSCCTLPFCIALLIYWLKPDLKAYLNAL
jgi:hypothetical protein